MNRISASAQESCTLEPGRTRTDYKERVLSGSRRYDFRVPALSPLFTHGGILRAPDRCHSVVARHADIASDAFANVVDVSVLDLFGQEGVGDGGAGSPDHVEDPASNLRHHGIRRRKAAHADHGLGGQLLDESHELFLIPFLREARGL